ncbi:MAG: glycosyltransferase family 39 protein [Actinobacteria bacterium]|nr:glycosyltransferase family 39 protein [Actinomycetota bacterium]
MTDEADSPAATGATGWRWVLLPLGAFAASRLVTMSAVYLVRFLMPGWTVLETMSRRWDGPWYLDIARYGYPEATPTGQSLLGFFPLYPLLTRWVSHITGMRLEGAAVLVNTLAAAIAVVLVWRLAESYFGHEVANRAAFLFAFFPGSYAFTFAYTEGVFLACAAGTLLLLERRRWWWAALVAGIGSAARPTGYVLALCCAFAVVMHWRRTRDWKPLPTPAVAAGGFVVFLVYLHVHTGDAFAWQRAQERGWGQRLDLGQTTVNRIIDYARNPVDDLNLLVPILSVFALVALVWMLAKARPPGTWWVFVVASVVPGLLSTSVALTPRHLFAAFPLVIGAAWALRDELYYGALAVCAGTLGIFMLITGGTTFLTP